MNNTLTSDSKLILESMIDADSLRAVLDAIANICSEKADHLRCNWQDEKTAQAWSDCGQRLSRHADAVCYSIVSK